MDSIILLTWKWVTLISGIYFLALGILVKTDNAPKALVFKVLPFTFGLTNLGIGLKLSGL